MFSHTCRVCSVMSPTPAIVPSERRAVIPETKTSRPFASTTVAWENTPVGFLIRSDETSRLGMSASSARYRPASSLAVGVHELGHGVDGLRLDTEEAVLRLGLAGFRLRRIAAVEQRDLHLCGLRQPLAQLRRVGRGRDGAAVFSMG